jgi:hypothetical protein
MSKKYMFIVLFIPLLLWQCSTGPNPRKTVLDFLEAVHKSDSVAILFYADLDKMAEQRLPNLPPEQKEKLVPIMKNDLLKNLVDNGSTRIWWENCLKVVAGEKRLKDQAEVEVTLIDQKTGVKRYTKMKLYFKDKRWRIYYFEE